MGVSDENKFTYEDLLVSLQKEPNFLRDHYWVQDRTGKWPSLNDFRPANEEEQEKVHPRRRLDDPLVGYDPSVFPDKRNVNHYDYVSWCKKGRKSIESFEHY